MKLNRHKKKAMNIPNWRDTIYQYPNYDEKVLAIDPLDNQIALCFFFNDKFLFCDDLDYEIQDVRWWLRIHDIIKPFDEDSGSYTMTDN